MKKKTTLCWLSLGAGLGILATSTFLFLRLRHGKTSPGGGKIREILEEADRLLHRTKGSARKTRPAQS